MTIRKLAFVGLAAGGGLLLLWLVGGNAYARYRERQVERAWVQSFGTYELLLSRYPKTTTNETARRLETLVKPLGLDLTPKTHEAITAHAVSSRSSSESEVERGRHAVSSYLTAELESPKSSIDLPPKEVSSFLSAHLGDLRAVEEELLTRPPPVWSHNPSIASDRQPIPDTTALISLQRTLLGKALEESARGDDSDAQRTLDASWKLNSEYRRIPDALCQIVALAAASRQVGVLRKIAADAGLWRTRVFEHDYKQSRLDAELLWSWPTAAKPREWNRLAFDGGKNVARRAWSWFLRPYSILVSSQFTEGLRKDYLEIRESSSVRDIPDEKTTGRTPAQIMLSIHIPNTHSSFRRVDEFLIDAELTDKILQARQLRQQNGGKWPAAISGIDITRLPGARWVYSVSAEGMRIELNQNPYKDRGGFKLPFCFTSS